MRSEMSLKVIGAGWSRTGTFSLRLALQQLGLGPCYHMHEVFLHPEHPALWRRAAAGKLESWSELLGEYQSVADTPACLFWRELVRGYPGAKVVLTLRDPNDWYESMCSTLYPMILASAAGSSAGDRAASDLARELVFDGFFGGKFSDRQSALALFDEHNGAVRREVPSERLLVYEVSQGWQPLCDFLELPMPAAPFPRSNDRAGFRRRAGLDG
jgi:hypothetical protein